MEKKIVFTIVAKNYLPLARALGWSLREHNKTPIEFIIFLADEEDGLVQREEGETIIPVSSLGIENLNDWAFKYNVTEFCTSVKPSCFKYLFSHLEADSAIYFDPDIFVFSDLTPIFKNLEEKDIVVTPHYITPQVEYGGVQKEQDTLFVGIFNFGFIAFKNVAENVLILDWWENRLSNQCYADKQDALHTDQKWGDFLPVFAGERLCISKSIGYNLAPWNVFEREILIDEGKFWVKNRLTEKVEPLVFVHFAGYDPENLSLIHKDFWSLKITDFPDYDLVRSIYFNKTSEFNFLESRKITYTYSQYSNGIFIQDVHRRLYRALTENGHKLDDPFNAELRFYQILFKNKMIDQSKPIKSNSKTLPNFSERLNAVKKILKLGYKVLGFKKYFLLMKLLNRYTRSENQVFLIGENIDKIY